MRFAPLSAALATIVMVVKSMNYASILARSRKMSSLAAAPRLLSSDERSTRLKDLLNSGWTILEKRDAITKSFTFKDFVECFGVMTQIALESERANHHPEWFNVYNRLDVTLSTHDCQGLSELDIHLALKIDELTKTN